MNNNYKYLIWSGTAVLVILGLFLLVLIGHISNTATTTNTISFSGEGKVSAKPDVSVVNFSIVTEAVTSKAAQNDNSAKSKKVVDFLKDQGIADKDIKTRGYNVYPQYSYPRPISIGVSTNMGYPVPPNDNGNPKITGYQVTQSFEVKVRDLTKVGAVLDGLVAQGANQVNNLGFQIDNPEKIKDEARAMAIADAKAKADSLRSQLGIRLGKIVNYTEGGGGYPVYMLEAKTTGGDSGSGPSTPTGENEITVDVTITYQIR